jgi:hypothetical protein
VRQRPNARVTRVIVLMMIAAGFAIASATLPAAAQNSSDAFQNAARHFGTWTGTWDGAGTGGFELILEKKSEGVAGGKVSVTGEPTYKATLKTVTFTGEKMTALYDFPPDDRLEIALTATFDGDTAKGTWTARGKDGGAEMMSGGWNVKKKP